MKLKNLFTMPEVRRSPGGRVSVYRRDKHKTKREEDDK
jgi:hypothetical protein